MSKDVLKMLGELPRLDVEPAKTRAIRQETLSCFEESSQGHNGTVQVFLAFFEPTFAYASTVLCLGWALLKAGELLGG